MDRSLRGGTSSATGLEQRLTVVFIRNIRGAGMRSYNMPERNGSELSTSQNYHLSRKTCCLATPVFSYLIPTIEDDFEYHDNTKILSLGRGFGKFYWYCCMYYAQCSEAVSPVRSEHDLCRSVPRPATKFLTQAGRQSGRFDLTGLQISGGRWCH